MNRRNLIKSAAALSTLTMFSSLSWASKAASEKKLVWIILRGAQDGLSTLLPLKETSLEAYRPTLWNKIKPHCLHISNEFALHPNLTALKDMYELKELIAIPATSTGYSARSHFEGQDYMECGLEEFEHNSGWLGRLLETLSGGGVAISPMTPLCMRGTNKSSNWYPSNFPTLNLSTYEEIIELYSSDQLLQDNLNNALKNRNLFENKIVKESGSSFAELCINCAQIMSSDDTISIATLELDGWDTHSNQHRRLINQMQTLNTGILNLKKHLKQLWKDTSVVITTEFGRTVRENGTKGTDHGTASTMFIAGGSIDGGRILGKWPGLEPEQLYNNRDLRPVNNSFSYIAKLLAEKYGLSEEKIKKILPAPKIQNVSILKIE